MTAVTICGDFAAAKLLQSWPIDGSPPGSAVPGILPARTLKWVAISFLEANKIKSATVSTVSPSICLEVMEPDA